MAIEGTTRQGRGAQAGARADRGDWTRGRRGPRRRRGEHPEVQRPGAARTDAYARDLSALPARSADARLELRIGVARMRSSTLPRGGSGAARDRMAQTDSPTRRSRPGAARPEPRPRPTRRDCLGHPIASPFRRPDPLAGQPQPQHLLSPEHLHLPDLNAIAASRPLTGRRRVDRQRVGAGDPGVVPSLALGVVSSLALGAGCTRGTAGRRRRCPRSSPRRPGPRSGRGCAAASRVAPSGLRR